jgi:hypothetical protein
MKSTSMSNRSAFDIANIVAGLGLLLSPWFLGYADQTAAAWNAWIVGIAIAVIAAAALFAFNRVEEWMNLALGVWAVIAPWALGFAALAVATWVHVIAGLVVAVLAIAGLWFTHNRPLSTA